MKKIILISLLLIILAAGGFFAYLSQMDWNTQKEKISAQMSEITGKKIQFSGDLQVKLFPQPQLSANNVDILNPQTGEKLATIKQLHSEVSLTSILKRKPDIKSLTMDGIEVWITFDTNGVNNWQQKSKQVSFVNESTFNLQNFNIKKSIVHFNFKKYNFSFDLTDFGAEISISGQDGPYRLDGSFLKGKDHYGIVLSVDSSSQEDISLRAAISHEETGSLDYEGTYNPANNNLNGSFRGQFKKTADFINKLFDKEIIREEFNLPLNFDTSAQFDETEKRFSDLVIISDGLLRGSGDVVVYPASKNKKGKVNIKYKFVNFNLLPFEKMLHEYFTKLQKGEKYEPNFSFNVFYDITSEKVTVSKEALGILENVGLKGEWKDNILSIDDFYAGAPGNTTLGIKASLTEKESVPQYYVGAKIIGQNALSFLNSMGIKIKSPRQSSYRNIDLTLDLSGTPQFLSIENIDLKMDKAEVRGNVFIDLFKNEYSIIGDTDILNLDNYIMPGDASENSSLSEKVITEIKRFSWLINNKVTVVFTAGGATFNGLSARNIVFDVTTDGSGAAIVEDISLQNMLGTDIALSGIVKNLGRNDLIFDAVTYNIKSSNLKTFAEKWGINLPQWPLFERSSISESGTLLGNLQKIYVNSLTTSGEHSFLYTGTLIEENEKLNFAGNIQLKTGHVESLIKLITNNVSGKIYHGPLTARAEISGNSSNWDLKNSEIQMGMDAYTANLSIGKDKKRHRISGDVQTTNLNLMNWINVQKTKSIPKFSSSSENTFIAKPNFSGDVINYSGYSNFALDIDLNAEKSAYGEYSMNNLQTHIYNDHNLLRFQNLQFDNKNHSVKGELQISYAQTPQLQGNLTISYPKIKNLGGEVYAINAQDVVISTEFDTSAATINDMINGLSGKMKITGGQFTVKGLNLAGIQDDLRGREYSKGLYKVVKDNTQSGETAFDGFSIEALMNNSVFTLSPSTVKNSIATVNVSGSLNLKEWKINNSFKVTYPELENVPSYTFVFSGMLNKPTVDIDIADIVNKYDKYWKKIEEERQKQEEMLIQQRAEKINKLRELIEATSEKATAVLHELEEGMSKHLTDKITGKYKSNISEINDINSHLEKIKTLLSTDLTDEDMAKHNEDINGYSQKLDEIKSGVQSLFTEDIESKKEELAARENDVYSKIKNIDEKFQSMWQQDRDQLGTYNSLQYIDGHEELNRNYSKIRENREAADNIHADIENRFSQFSVPENWDEKHELAKSIENLIEQEESLYAQMQDIHQQSAETLLKIIDERKIAFENDRRRAEEERQKQAEIDAQNLLLSGNSSAPTQTADNIGAESNTPMENGTAYHEETDSNVITAPGVSGKIVTQYDRNEPKAQPTVRPTGNLLTPIEDGAPSMGGNYNVSGSITVN